MGEPTEPGTASAARATSPGELGVGWMEPQGGQSHLGGPPGRPALSGTPITADRSLWSYQEIAVHIHVLPDTVRTYRKYGLLPQPDHVDAGKPLWYADTIHAWHAARPRNRSRGQGSRFT